MKNQEIVKQLQESANWIYEVSNRSDEQHIKDMLRGLEVAIGKLSVETIEIDVAYYHPDDNENERVYDEEGMKEEFEYKLDCLIKNAVI
jgi:sortase (surface protein transpeptidase)